MGGLDGYGWCWGCLMFTGWIGTYTRRLTTGYLMLLDMTMMSIGNVSDDSLKRRNEEIKCQTSSSIYHYVSSTGCSLMSHDHVVRCTKYHFMER